MNTVLIRDNNIKDEKINIDKKITFEDIKNECRKRYAIFIKGNVPSSKNSKQWTGKMLISSKTVRNYLKDYEYQWKSKENIEKFKDMIKNKEKPYKICFYFIRNSKRKFDYINIAQLPQDLMVKHKWLDDDNCDEMKPIFKGYSVDKENTGVFIWIE